MGTTGKKKQRKGREEYTVKELITKLFTMHCYPYSFTSSVFGLSVFLSTVISNALKM
jgi:hypothetical protein